MEIRISRHLPYKRPGESLFQQKGMESLRREAEALTVQVWICAKKPEKMR